MSVTKDYDTILRGRRRACMIFIRACKAYDSQNLEDAMKYCKLAADRGLTFAQYKVGILCINHDPPMYQEAFKYFSLAADQGKRMAAEAFHQLGSLCERQELFDYEKSFKFFKIAADMGFSVSQKAVGFLYLRRGGVKRNVHEAFRYFSLAAEQGNRDALYYLGKCKLLGLGTVVDCKAAFTYFKLASSTDYGYDNAARDIDVAIAQESKRKYCLRDTGSAAPCKKRKISWVDL